MPRHKRKKVDKELIPYLEDMLNELKHGKGLQVVLVPSKTEPTGMIRAVESENIQWYKDLCNAFQSKNKKKQRRKNKTKGKKQKAKATTIKKWDTMATLITMIEQCVTNTGERGAWLIEEARRRLEQDGTEMTEEEMIEHVFRDTT
jgi:hypothetical protein